MGGGIMQHLHTVVRVRRTHTQDASFLTTRSTYIRPLSHCSGLVNSKAVGVVAAETGVKLVTKTKAAKNKPAKGTRTTVLNGKTGYVSLLSVFPLSCDICPSFCLGRFVLWSACALVCLWVQHAMVLSYGLRVGSGNGWLLVSVSLPRKSVWEGHTDPSLAYSSD